MFFTERLALLLETGNALHTSLDTLAEQVDNPSLREVINKLKEDIAAGVPFSQALEKHPQIFSKTYVNLVAASEQGGFMAEVLDQLMKMEEKRLQLISTLQTALYYPTFLIIFSIAVVLFVLIFVFPKFGNLFTEIVNDLPITTRLLLNISDALRHYFIYIVAAIAGMTYLFIWWLKSPEGSAIYDRLKLKMPLIRDIFIQLYMLQLMRVMSLSLTHGVGVLDALKSSYDVVRNTVFKDFLNEVEHHVNEGQGIAIAFQKSDFIPGLVQQMITTGEETGNLSLVLTRIADFYERELTKKLKIVTKIIEPALLLCMGLLVGLIVSSLILPIFKLSRVVH